MSLSLYVRPNIFMSPLFMFILKQYPYATIVTLLSYIEERNTYKEKKYT